MRTLAAMIAALLVAILAAGPSVAQAQAPKASLPDIEDEVMCVECGTALNISQSPAAEGERRFIRRRIAEGMTKEEIKAALVAEYGPNVLASPPDRGFARAVYIVPIALAILAALGIAVAVRRWRREPEPAGGRRGQRPAGDLSDDDRARLERDMAGYDL